MPNYFDFDVGKFVAPLPTFAAIALDRVPPSFGSSSTSAAADCKESSKFAEAVANLMSLVVGVVSRLDRVEESVGTISASINQKASECDDKITAADTEKQRAKLDVKPAGASS